jgi:hypothetical protein
VLSLADVFQRAGKDVSWGSNGIEGMISDRVGEAEREREREASTSERRSSDDKSLSATTSGVAKTDVKGKGRAEAGGGRKTKDRKKREGSSNSSRKTSKGWEDPVSAGLLEEELVEPLFDWYVALFFCGSFESLHIR